MIAKYYFFLPKDRIVDDHLCIFTFTSLILVRLIESQCLKFLGTQNIDHWANKWGLSIYLSISWWGKVLIPDRVITGSFLTTMCLWCPDKARKRHGHAIDMAGIQIVDIKSEVSDKIQHDMLPILKHPCIIALCIPDGHDHENHLRLQVCWMIWSIGWSK